MLLGRHRIPPIECAPGRCEGLPIKKRSRNASHPTLTGLPRFRLLPEAEQIGLEHPALIVLKRLSETSVRSPQAEHRAPWDVPRNSLDPRPQAPPVLTNGRVFSRFVHLKRSSDCCPKI